MTMTTTYPAPATPEAAAILAAKIANTNNGYLFNPNAWESEVARAHPALFPARTAHPGLGGRLIYNAETFAKRFPTLA